MYLVVLNALHYPFSKSHSAGTAGMPVCEPLLQLLPRVGQARGMLYAERLVPQRSVAFWRAQLGVPEPMALTVRTQQACK